MPLEPTPDRKLTPDEEPESEPLVISTDCCDKLMFKDDTYLVKRLKGYGRFCDECLTNKVEEVKVCQ